jgi:hypothetical protein
MSKGAFVERLEKPLLADILRILSSAQAQWKAVVGFTETECKAKGELKFYGKNGWALRFKKSGQVAGCSISVAQ